MLAPPTLNESCSASQAPNTSAANAAKFYSATLKIDREAAHDNRKGAGRVGVTLEAHGPTAGVGDAIVGGNSAWRIPTPTGKNRARLIFETQRLLESGAGKRRLGKDRHVGGKKDPNKEAYLHSEWEAP